MPLPDIVFIAGGNTEITMNLQRIIRRIVRASTIWHADVTIRGYRSVDEVAAALDLVGRKLREGNEAGNVRTGGGWISWSAWTDRDETPATERNPDSPYPSRLVRE